jgi:hypothetical protein
MSMIGHFLAVTPQELDALVADPTRFLEFVHETRAGEILDIDKAWQAIHFTLTGEPFGGEPPLANVIFGVRPIEGTDVGVGPALGTPAPEVRKIASAVGDISEADFRARLDPAALQQADIYQPIWGDGDEALDYVVENFKAVQRFYAQAAEKKLAVITFIS